VGDDIEELELIVLRLFFIIWLALKVNTFRPSMMISSPFGIYDEVTKSGNFYFFAALQTALDNIEGRLNHVGGVLLGKANFLVDPRDDFRFRHIPPLP
jgi:hypothetical protein